VPRSGRKGLSKPNLAEAQCPESSSKQAVTPWAQIVRQGRTGPGAPNQTPGLATCFLAVALQTPEAGRAGSSAASPDGSAAAASSTDGRRKAQGEVSRIREAVTPPARSAAVDAPLATSTAPPATPVPASPPATRPVDSVLSPRAAEASLVTAADILRGGGCLTPSASPDAPAQASGAPRGVASATETPAKDVCVAIDAEPPATSMDRPTTPPRDALMSPSKRQNDARSPPQRPRSTQPPSHKKPRNEDGGATKSTDAGGRARAPPNQPAKPQPPLRPRRQGSGPAASLPSKRATAAAAAPAPTTVQLDFGRDRYQSPPDDALAVLDAACSSFVVREVKRAAQMDRPACELTAQLQAAVAGAWPGAAVVCYGSRATGLAGATSDVDLVIVGIGDLVRHHDTVIPRGGGV